MKYERLENEPEYEYGLRLIATKIEENPDDLDWQDIVELLGLDMHRDSLRKAASTTPYSGYAVMKYFEKKYASESFGDSDFFTRYDAKIAEFKKEAQKYYDQRREFNKLVRNVGRSENLEDRLVEAANKLSENYPISIDRQYAPCGENEAVIIFADWHYGMVANNVWECYNTDICKKRVGQLVRESLNRIVLHECNRLHIVLLGDMAHGAIHTTARVASEELVCDQVMQVSEIIAESINQLSSVVNETVIHATYGNHLRTVQSKQDNIHADNIEKLIQWWLKQRFSGREDIVFDDSDYYEFLCFDVLGHTVCAVHGDLDNVKSAGKTIGTLFNKAYGKNIEYVILADKHHSEQFEELGIDCMIASSLCGSDEYANTKRLYSRAGQTLIIFNEQDGKDATYQIHFEV